MQEIVRVLIRGDNAKNERLYHVPIDLKVADVLYQWKNEVGTTSAARFLDMDSVPVEHHLCLSELKQIRPGLIELTFEKEMKLSIKINKMNYSLTVSVWPSETFGDLLRFLLKDREDTDFHSPFHEITHDGLKLDFGAQISSLNTGSDNIAVLIIKMPLSVTFSHHWENRTFVFDEMDADESCDNVRAALVEGMKYLQQKERDDVIEEMRKMKREKQKEITKALCHYRTNPDDVFSFRKEDEIADSETSAARNDYEKDMKDSKTGDDYALPLHLFKRVNLKGRLISFYGSVSKILESFGEPWKERFDFVLDVPWDINIFVNQSWHRRRVWPTERVSSISNHSVFADGVFHSPEKQLVDLDLAEGALVFLDPVIITLQLTSGLRRCIRLPRIATVKDLRHIASREEGDTSVQLMYGHRYLTNDYELLVEAGLRSGSHIRVEMSLFDIGVVYEGRRVSWQERQPHLDYTAITAQACSILGVDLMKMDGAAFLCIGCGRRICKEEEEYQRVPDNCCSKQSRELEMRISVCDKSENIQSEIDVLIVSIQQFYEELIKTNVVNLLPKKMFKECQTLREICNHFGVKYNNLIKRTEGVREFLVKLRSSVQQWEINFKNLYKEKKSLEGKMKNLNSSASQQKVCNTTLKADKKSLEGKVKNLQNSQNQLQVNNGKLKTDNKALRNSVLELEKKVKELHSSLAKMETKNTKLVDDNKTLQTKNVKLVDDNKTLQTKIAKLVDDIKNLEKINDTLSDDNKTLKKSKKSFQASALKLRLINGNLKADNKTLNETVADLRKSGSNLEANNKTLQSEYSLMGIRSGEIQASSHRLKAQNDAVESKRKKLQSPAYQRDHLDETPQGPSQEIVKQRSSLFTSILHMLTGAAKDRGVKLLVFYMHSLTPVYFHPAVQEMMKYQWSELPHIKCKFDKGLSPGWNSFSNIRAALSPLFIGDKICGIKQSRGKAVGQDVAEITSPLDDEAVEHDQRVFGDSEGRTFVNDDVTETVCCKVACFDLDSKAIFICGGEARTVIMLPSSSEIFR